MSSFDGRLTTTPEILLDASTRQSSRGPASRGGLTLCDTGITVFGQFSPFHFAHRGSRRRVVFDRLYVVAMLGVRYTRPTMSETGYKMVKNDVFIDRRCIGIMLPNLSDGSTLQWRIGQGLLCLELPV